MFKEKDKVFVVAFGKAQVATVVSADYHGTFLETALVELSDTSQGRYWQTKRHDKIIPFPVVGMGASAGYGGDSYPYTVVSVSKSGRQIEVQRDNYEYVGPPREYGDPGQAKDWVYTPDTTGYKYPVKLNKNGDWKGVGYLSLGHRSFRQDPSF